jgi:hypothetical protein
MKISEVISRNSTLCENFKGGVFKPNFRYIYVYVKGCKDANNVSNVPSDFFFHLCDVINLLWKEVTSGMIPIP